MVGYQTRRSGWASTAAPCAASPTSPTSTSSGEKYQVEVILLIYDGRSECDVHVPE